MEIWLRNPVQIPTNRIGIAGQSLGALGRSKGTKGALGIYHGFVIIISTGFGRICAIFGVLVLVTVNLVELDLFDNNVGEIKCDDVNIWSLEVSMREIDFDFKDADQALLIL